MDRMTETLTAEGEGLAQEAAAGPQDTAAQPALLSGASVTIIAPRPGWRALNVREMWAYRELLFFLTWRDVKVRYKQTLLGAAWAVLQPLMYSCVFFVVFYRVAHVPAEGMPYPLFAFSGLVLWFFFSTAITQAGNSVIGSEGLITKVYFPRLAIPFAAVGAALFDFAITLVVLLVMIGYYAFFTTQGSAISLTWNVLLVPLLILLTVLAALGVGTFLAALNVSFRDFKHTIPFLVQLWLFATPAIYMGIEHGNLVHSDVSDRSAQQDRRTPIVPEAPPQASHLPAASRAASPHSVTKPLSEGADKQAAPADGAVPNWVQSLLKFNPMTGLIRSFRAAILGQPMPWTHLAYSAVIVVAIFLGGCFYYHRVEDEFADII